MIIINSRIEKSEGQVTELIYIKDNQTTAAKVNIVSNKRIISLNRTVNKLLPLEVTDEKKEEVPTFIDEECGSGMECQGSGM